MLPIIRSNTNGTMRFETTDLGPEIKFMCLAESYYLLDKENKVCFGADFRKVAQEFKVEKKETVDEFEKRIKDIQGQMPSYGFSVHGRDLGGIHLNWGEKYSIIHLPWEWNFYKRWEQVKLYNWNKDIPQEYAWIEVPQYGYDHGKIADKYQSYYNYNLSNGELQTVIATYYVSKMEWRWRWLPFLPWPNLTKVSISVNFSDEVGERSGSWKGGVTGCGHEMKKGESAEDTLRRMEKEVKL